MRSKRAPCRSRRIGLLVSLFLTACAGHQPSLYEASMDAAELARRRGDSVGERAHFTAAARAAESSDDREEARYRRAWSFIRQGHLRRGVSELRSLVESAPLSGRAARAWLDMGRTHEKLGDPGAARAAYRTVVTRFPDSGNALTAAKRYVALTAKSDRERSALYQKWVEDNTTPSLDEGLRYEWAESLKQWAPSEALRQFQTLARLYPLPRGTRTDDALLRSAELLRAQQDFSGAVRTLGELLKRDQKALFLGSYARTTYVEGFWLLAEIQRDDLSDCRTAAATFLEMTRRFPTSRRSDDALYQSALCLRRLGQDTCRTVKRLQKNYPESSLASCASHLCRKLADDRPTPSHCPGLP